MLKPIVMKKIYSFLIVLLSLIAVSDSIAQNPHPWELGLNGGAAWLKSDVKMKKLGPGFGFTFGQTYCYNETSPLFWGWRFRYLGSTTYGQDYQKSFGLKNNFALNGQNDTTLNYFSNGGYVYQNYKTSLSEFSLEVKIGANQLRRKTNILMYVFGGAGLVKSVTKLDQLDENNKRYNYDLVDSAGNGSKSDILSRLNDIYDGSYETLAEGSKNPKWRFMPYVGVGLGYQFTKGFSMGFEHKMTWTRNDLVDGQQWTSTNENTGTNDMYHYSSVWMKFSFGGKGRTTSTTATTNSNVNTYTDVNTNTNTNNNTNTTVNTTTTAAVEVPKITFTSPTSNPFSTTQNTITITANVLNVANSSGINLIYNGAAVNGFTYANNVLSYTTPLVVGNNNFVVNATNTSGTVTASTNVTYSAPVVSTPAPIVAITNPVGNPFNTSQGIIIVNGTVQNITSKSQMQVTVNGVVDNNFIYTPSTKTFSVSANLIPGANAFVISATNAGGTDSRSVTVIYQQQIIQNTAPAPVVTILSPNVNPYTVSTPTTNVVASVMNVTSQSQIVLTQNGIITPFSFNVNSHQLSYNALLAVGANTITITATNSGGSDSKTETVIYNKPVTVAQPIVTITNPSTAVTNSTLTPTPINAIVQNVTAIGQLAVTVNGGPVMASALNFNVASGQLSFNANLIVGANTITVSATNIAGMDSKSITIVYEQAAPPVMPPSVTITNPVANPFTTTLSTQVVNANVLNVNSQNQISVSLNGAAIPFNFNAASHQLSLTANLIQGANVVSITATNAVNSDSKSITIIYNRPATVPAPVVTITSPAASPFTTTTNTVAIGATIQNVTAVGQLAVTVNGGPVMTSALNFNSTTGQLNFNANLVQGANTITVSATNIAGADSKTKTVIYNQPAPVVVPPVITVITPYTNPSSTSVNSETVSATVANVNASNQITVSLNGVNSNFNFNSLTHQLNFVANLIVGTNTVVITATNAAGTDSKTITFNYSIPVQLLPPVVSFINPATTTETSNAATYAVVAKTLNVNTSNQVTVTVNGAAITNFVMQPITKKISFTANLNLGANVITVSATNNSGTDTKSVTINYVRLIDVMSPDTLNTPNVGRPNKPNLNLGTPNTANLPVITVGLPASTPFTTSDASYTIGGSITGVVAAANIVIKQNNVVVPFNYLITKKTFSATLNLANGTNTILIEATNASGTKTQTIVINKQ